MRDSRDLNSLHGHFRTGPGGYSRLLEEDPNQPSAKVLEELAARMVDTPDKPSDKPDPEENLYVPAGYTYLSQFVDHDLTFDTTSTLDPTDSTAPTNQRTPRFDLDSVYGPGPAAAPFMYQDGVRLVECEADLPRSAPQRGEFDHLQFADGLPPVSQPCCAGIRERFRPKTLPSGVVRGCSERSPLEVPEDSRRRPSAE